MIEECPLQPQKRTHKALAMEGSDIEDMTDLFKKARTDHKGVTKGESGQMTQQSLDYYGWRKLDAQEKLEQSQKDFANIRDDMETFCHEEEEKRVIKKQHAQDMARERQQRHRDQVKAQKAEHAGKPVCEALRSSPTDIESYKNQLELRHDSPEVLSNIAALSRPENVKWKKSRSGKKGGTVQQQHQRTNTHSFGHILMLPPKKPTGRLSKLLQFFNVSSLDCSRTSIVARSITG